jgi:hypothetical protein
MPVAAHGTTPSASALDFTTARSWPRRVKVRTATLRARIQLQGIITAHWRPRHGTRQAHGSAAPRGSPRSSQRQTQHEGAFTSTADAACLGWQRRGGASRATRVVALSWGNSDPPTLGVSKARAQASPREGNGAREEETTVLTAGRRCSRCRLEVDGGAA